MRPVAPANRPNQSAMDKLTSLHRRVSSTMQPIIVQAPVEQTIAKPVPTVTMAKPMPMGIPAFKPLPPKEETLAVLPIASTRKTYTPLQVPQSKGPGLAYQSEIYPSHNQISKMVSQMTAEQFSPVKFTQSPVIVEHPKLYSITTVNPFVPMPPSQAISLIPAPAFKEIQRQPYSPNSIIQKHPLSNFVDPVPHQVHDIANNAVYNTKKVDDYNSITGYGDDTVLKINKEEINSKIAEIAKAGNISMEAVEAAIALRQQQLLSKYANIPAPIPAPSTTSSTTSTTTEQPFVFQQEPEPEILTAAIPQKPPKRTPISGKVMNAPREYYPVGYEKNFDDHFQSKVDLPETNFHCGDQKYFPGLYGDESLGCMTILKCNWWFYVDCKNTKKLYDTNIPVSKSYQLMKALTFFSSYKKEMQDGQKTNPEDVDGIKEAISILQNQDTSRPNAPVQTNAGVSFPNAPSVSNTGSTQNTASSSSHIQFITPTPIIDERNKKTTTETAPVYRGNRNLNATRNFKKNSSSAENTSDIKLITVNADINIANGNVTENDSRERKHRRRMTLRNTSIAQPTTTSTTTTSTTTSTTQKPTTTTPSIEIIKVDIQPIENIQRQEKLTDQIEDVNPNTANSAPVRRFYRSSAEKFEDKEMAIVNNEKVQIVRPTSHSRLVGHYPTPSATIAKLDEAVLGKIRTKKQAIAIVTPEKHSPET
ncbi:hypothetical protein HF086_008864 [Spodoptera exigua]|uniref:Uncharacterized protein n=1 Tax=Spodoptera exigua TaxID=7107 RepID=A0A922M8G7_SPOEX|nr:hypothetical protein HF086_008864 [Spodoptera exigua]